MHDTLRIQHPRKPRMIAHRGMSGLEMENTASAFVAAGQRSYFGIETDVHRTADGRYIIIHDDRTGRVAGDDLAVEKSSYETLRSLRLLDTDGQRGRRDLMLPSLDEYIGICKKYQKTAVLELKNHFAPADIDGIIAVIRERDYLAHTVFISFDLPNLLCVRDRLPEQEMQYLSEEFPEALLPILAEKHMDVDLWYQPLTREQVERLHALGLRVNVWTVNDPEDARRLMEMGVDDMTTNILE